MRMLMYSAVSLPEVNLRTSGFVQHTVPVLPLLLDDSRDLVHTDLDALFLDNLTTSVEKRVPQWLDGMQELDVGEGGDHDLWQEGEWASCTSLHRCKLYQYG